ncbi:MAG: hypothetical protein RBT59_09280 [Arcobacteraceae bacterium]|jgi:hypothetical protein|nr:hypothetical protein [Arcobacteraceae bacterium]
MDSSNSIPSDILKIQKKMCEFEIGSRNYKKYQKILSKHVKKYTMKARVNSNIKTIEVIKDLEK